MLAPKHSWFYPVVLAVFVILNLAACADYPSNPRAPESGDDTYTTEEDVFLVVPVEEGVLANDQAKEGATVFLDTVGEIKTLNGGTVNMAEDGSFSYEPPANFNGDDQATYSIHNSKGKNDESTIFINVTPVNDPPNPQDDQMETSIDQPVRINALENDVEPDGDTMAIESVGPPDSGSAQVNADGTLTYIPQAGHTGDVSFEYVVLDESGQEGKARVFVNIGGDTGIQLQDDTISVAEGQSANIPATDLLANDQDTANAAPLTLIAVGEAQNGTVELQNDTVIYTPNPDYSGSDRFTYTAQSVDGITASATVNVTVTPVQDAPTITDIPDQQINQGESTGWLHFEYSDPDTPAANIAVFANAINSNPADLIPENGIQLFGSANGAGAIQVIPNSILSGTATIRVTVRDREGNEGFDDFVVTVNPAYTNTPPTIYPASIPDQYWSIGESYYVDVTIGDLETPPNSLNFNVDSSAVWVVGSDYYPLAVDQSVMRVELWSVVLGQSQITIQVTDEGGLTASVIFQVDVSGFFLSSPNSVKSRLSLSASPSLQRPSKTAPLPENDIYSPNVDQTLKVGANRGVLVNDRDIQDRTLRVTPFHNSCLTLNTDGSFIYTPSKKCLTDKPPVDDKQSFAYTVSNGIQSAEAKLTFVVGGNQVPTAVADGYVLDGGRTLNITAGKGLLSNDIDQDKNQLFILKTSAYDTLFGGEVNVLPDGSFSYLSPADFDGFDSFTYTVSDGVDSAIGIAEISVTP